VEQPDALFAAGFGGSWTSVLGGFIAQVRGRSESGDGGGSGQ
jgi:hypothetical protein